MNSSQIHLALTHVPVILSFVGFVILIIALIRKNNSLTKTSFSIFLAAGLFVIPVYLTGEGTEEVVENLPGVSEGIISKHEQFANISLTIVLICGIASLVGLLLFNRFLIIRPLKYFVLFFAFGSAITMAKTAHLGGQIRHTEIRSANVSRNQVQNAETNSKDDDD